MSDDNTKPEGPADVGKPADEGGKFSPDEDPSARNMSGSFPGDANVVKKTAEGTEQVVSKEEARAAKDNVAQTGAKTPAKPGSQT